MKTRSIIENIKSRYSCRTFDLKPIEAQITKRLCDFINSINNEVKIKARFVYISNNAANETPEKLGTYGMITGATNYIIGIFDKAETSYATFGYLFEEIILFATELNLQTCWLGGTFNRKEFDNKCNLQENEYIAIVSPVGYKKEKPRFLEKVIRKATGADNRKTLSEIFFNNNLNTPLNLEEIGEYKIPLEMARISPSASNKQPWIIIKNNNEYDFYLKRTKGYPKLFFDMQKNDIGIAMCHFEKTAVEIGLKGKWDTKQHKSLNDLEYITTWIVDNN